MLHESPPNNLAYLLFLPSEECQKRPVCFFSPFFSLPFCLQREYCLSVEVEMSNSSPERPSSCKFCSKHLDHLIKDFIFQDYSTITGRCVGTAGWQSSRSRVWQKTEVFLKPNSLFVIHAQLFPTNHISFTPLLHLDTFSPRGIQTHDPYHPGIGFYHWARGCFI